MTLAKVVEFEPVFVHDNVKDDVRRAAKRGSRSLTETVEAGMIALELLDPVQQVELDKRLAERRREQDKAS